MLLPMALSGTSTYMELCGLTGMSLMSQRRKNPPICCLEEIVDILLKLLSYLSLSLTDVSDYRSELVTTLSQARD